LQGLRIAQTQQNQRFDLVVCMGYQGRQRAGFQAHFRGQHHCRAPVDHRDIVNVIEKQGCDVFKRCILTPRKSDCPVLGDALSLDKPLPTLCRARLQGPQQRDRVFVDRCTLPHGVTGERRTAPVHGITV
jgi:hypothetical protein